MEININWFWEHLREDKEEDYEIKGKPVRQFNSDYEKSDEEVIKQREDFLYQRLQEAIQQAAEEYVKTTVWKMEQSQYESIWDAMYDAFCDFTYIHRNEIKVISLNSSDDEESEPEEEPTPTPAAPRIYHLNKKQTEKVFKRLNSQKIYLESIKDHLTKSSISSQTTGMPSNIYVADEEGSRPAHNLLTYQTSDRKIYGNVIFQYGPKTYAELPEHMRLSDAQVEQIVL